MHRPERKGQGDTSRSSSHSTYRHDAPAPFPMSVPWPARPSLSPIHNHRHLQVSTSPRSGASKPAEKSCAILAHLTAATPSDKQSIEACCCLLSVGGPGPSALQCNPGPHSIAVPVHGEMAERDVQKVEVEKKKRGGPVAHVPTLQRHAALQVADSRLLLLLQTTSGQAPSLAPNIPPIRPHHSSSITPLSRSHADHRPHLLLIVTFDPTRPTLSRLPFVFALPG
ncbi:hypothetical protein IWX47DRAFT_511116 [Phyllosticta citricarpa]